MLKKLIDLIAQIFKRPAPAAPVIPEAWIGLDKFQAATGLNQDQAMAWYPHVRSACLEYDITGPVRVAAFLAQVGHESGGFKYTREIWGPTPAQQRYEGRADLGNTQPGDGSKYRGRGLIQITGRNNYAKASGALGIDLVSVPDQLELKPLAARSAAWWWSAHGCNELADYGDFERLTRRINGGLNGYADRVTRWGKAKAAL